MKLAMPTYGKSRTGGALPVNTPAQASVPITLSALPLLHWALQAVAALPQPVLAWMLPLHGAPPAFQPVTLGMDIRGAILGLTQPLSWWVVFLHPQPQDCPGKG